MHTLQHEWQGKANTMRKWNHTPAAEVERKAKELEEK